MSLLELSAKQLLAELSAGGVTAVEVAESYLSAIAQRDKQVGAFLRIDAAGALAKARDIDDRRRANKPVGRLAGLPVAVKDILCSRGETTTCGSRMLEHFAAPYDATVVARLKAADAILLIGRTNLDEFAMGGSTENSAFQVTRNPWDLSCFAGRIERRIGGLRCGGHGPLGDRHRYGRLDPAASRTVRRHRDEADVRSRESIRADRVCQQPGSGGADGTLGRGYGLTVGNDRRP